ncbi:hypothetical protein C8T65DRAFT_652611 [Cerioporus squamosus]|nr:hypothetical protein C8T65DRAFT_652611 [Cerioporus squamosus]
MQASSSDSPPQIRNDLATVAVYGDPGSGKHTLISLLNKRPYTRAEDKKSFAFNAQLGRKGSPASVAVVLYDPTNAKRQIAPFVHEARQAASSVCIVQTKMDLVPSDFSSRHLDFCSVAADMGYKYQVDCFDVGLTVGDGVDELLAYLMDCIDPLSMSRKETVRQKLGRYQDAFLDWIAALFALPTRQMASDVSSELSEITGGANVFKRFNSEMDVAWTRSVLQRLHIEDVSRSPRVHRISHSLLAKLAAPSERQGMDYVRNHTTIPVPRTHLPDSSLLVMDLVDGEMLWECWDKLGAFTRFRVACTLRLYVKQLRSLQRDTVGAVDTGYVSGILFGEDFYGPFNTLRRFRHFCEYVSCVGWRTMADIERNAGRTPPPIPRPKFDWTPVFVHGDLNLSNVLRDRHGTLWILDWDAAGFYPACMESAVMWNMGQNMLPEETPASWSSYRSFITGVTTESEAEQFWYSFYSAIHRFPGKPSV